jgi:hypothetical protein
MLLRVRPVLGGLVLAAVLAVGSAASAATVDLQFDRFQRKQLPAARGAMADFLGAHDVSDLRLETFEGYRAWNGKRGKANPRHTKVGRFRAIGQHGTGRSVISDGTKTQVRGDRMRWGRYNTDGVVGGKWLDSNDNTGMRWTISGVGAFNAVGFFVIDAADVGGKFSIKVGDKLYSNLAGTTGRLKNGNIHFVRILLDEAVENLTIVLKHNRTNDGFGIDGAAVATIAPVPVPAAGVFLASGLALLAGLRRRSASA